MKKRITHANGGMFGEVIDPFAPIPVIDLTAMLPGTYIDPMNPMNYTMPGVIPAIAPPPILPVDSQIMIPTLPPAPTPLPPGGPIELISPGSLPPSGALVDPSLSVASPSSVALPVTTSYGQMEADWKIRPLWQVLIEHLLGLYPQPLGTFVDKRFLDAYLVLRVWLRDPGFEQDHVVLQAVLAKRNGYVEDSAKRSLLNSYLSERSRLLTERRKLMDLKANAQGYIAYFGSAQVMPAKYSGLFLSVQDAQTQLDNIVKRLSELTKPILDIDVQISFVEKAMGDDWIRFFTGVPTIDEIYARYKDIVISIAKDHPNIMLRGLKADIEGALKERDAVMQTLIVAREAELAAERNAFIEFYKVESELYLNYGGLRENIAKIGKTIGDQRKEIVDKKNWFESEAAWLKAEGPAIQAFANAEAASIKEDAGIFNTGEIEVRADRLKMSMNARSMYLQQRAGDFKREADGMEAWINEKKAALSVNEEKYEVMKQEYGRRDTYIRSREFQHKAMTMFNDRKKFMIVNAGLERYLPAYMAPISYLIRDIGAVWDWKNLRGVFSFLAFNPDESVMTMSEANQIKMMLQNDIRQMKKEHPEVFNGLAYQEMLRFARAELWKPLSDFEYRSGTTEFKMQAADQELANRVSQYQKVLERAEEELLLASGAKPIDVIGLDISKKRIYYNASLRLVNDLAPFIVRIMSEFKKMAEKMLTGDVNEVEAALYEKARRIVVQYRDANKVIESLDKEIKAEELAAVGVTALSYEV